MDDTFAAHSTNIFIKTCAVHALTHLTMIFGSMVYKCERSSRMSDFLKNVIVCHVANIASNLLGKSDVEF